MEQTSIIFFVLASFFGIDTGRIAADKTTVTVNPEIKQIEIVQEDLFALVQSEGEKALTLAQWQRLKNWEENQISWSEALDDFPDKNLTFKSEKNNVRAHLILNYTEESDLRALGIWYDAEKDQFSINYIPQQNVKTEDGKLSGIYWTFSGDSTFSFNLEPFSLMPEGQQKLKIPVEKLSTENGKE